MKGVEYFNVFPIERYTEILVYDYHKFYKM